MSQINSNAAAFNVSDMVLFNDHAALAVQQRTYNSSKQSSQQRKPGNSNPGYNPGYQSGCNQNV